MKRLLILISILFMAGCVSRFNVEKANTYLSSHPDRPADIKEAISIGKVVTGMNEEEVSICMGKPGTISTTQAYPSNTKTTVWGYFNGGPSKRVFILFKDGTVTGINEISQTGMIMVQPSAPIISGPVMT
ncbi:MAG: hypothetical protein JXL81_03085, partial [Deltaproteobacteria bacterium]|nr:hypothetical protein [Deltaproteobacteria bacterium]